MKRLIGSSLFATSKKLFSNSSGQVMVLYAGIIAALVGVTALCSDVAVMYVNSIQMQKAVDSANEGHGSWERIQYFTLLPEDFSEAKGELSLKLDVKRKIVQEHYQKQIESMYSRTKKPD